MKTSVKKPLLFAEIITAAVLILFIVFCIRGNAAVRDDVSLDELKSGLLGAVSGAGNMHEAGAMKLKALYGLSENDYEEVVLYAPASNMDAQEMLLVRCKSTDQTGLVEEAMKKRIENQIKTFESYGVEQMAIISKAVVDIRGNYCLYICDADSGAVKDIFEQKLS